MTKDCNTYSECFGLDRLALSSIASLVYERNSKDGLKRDIVTKRCQLEVTERGEPELTPTAIRTALDATIKLKWVVESSGFIHIRDLGWQVFGHDKNGVSFAPSLCSVALSADESCQLILSTLTDIKQNKQYRYDPRINCSGEITIRELWTWAAMYGVNEVFFWRTLGGLLANQLVRVVPTGPDENLSLVSVTNAGLRAEAPSLEADPLIDEAFFLDYVESAEKDANKRANRIPDRASREWAKKLLVWNQTPLIGIALEDLKKFTVRAFPYVSMQPNLSTSILDWWEIPQQLLRAIDALNPAESDPNKMDKVRQYFADSPFPTQGSFGSNIIELLESKRLRVSEFRAVSKNVHGTIGPVLRSSQPCAAQGTDGLRDQIQAKLQQESSVTKTTQAPRRRKVAKRESRTVPDKKHMDAYKLHLVGKTYREIGIELGISHESARQWTRLAKQYVGDQGKAKSVRANKLPSNSRGQPTV